MRGYRAAGLLHRVGGLGEAALGRALDDHDGVRAREVRAGDRDGELVFKKALRKSLDSYTATTPPHVRAARLAGDGSRLIEYVITRAGPEPVGAARSPIDHEHYVDKELEPIARPVLEILGLDWDEVVGNPRQLGLF